MRLASQWWFKMSTFPHRRAQMWALPFLPPLVQTEFLNCTFQADSKIKFGFFALIQKPPRRCSRDRPGQTRECKRPPLKSANRAKFHRPTTTKEERHFTLRGWQ